MSHAGSGQEEMGKNRRIKGFLKKEPEKHVFQSLQSNCHWSDKETLLSASVHSAGLSELLNKQLPGVMRVMFILSPGLRAAALKATAKEASASSS